MDQAQLRRLVQNLCNPQREDGPAENFIVDIDEVGGGDVRGAEWRDELLAVLDPERDSREPVYFSGLPGSGKTTELRKVQQELRARGWYAVRIDLDQYVNLAEPIDLADVLTMLLYGVEQEVLRIEK